MWQSWLLPADAYRFAKGEQVTSSTGQAVKLSRPLDFLVVADHSDNMGFFPLLLSGDSRIVRNPQGRRWHEMVNAGGQTAVQAASELIAAFKQVARSLRPSVVSVSSVRQVTLAEPDVQRFGGPSQLPDE